MARRLPPADRRQELLAAAVACLARLGPRGATGREVCRQAGVSHGLLRHHFGDPDTLLVEAYTDLCERFLAELDQRLAEPGLDPAAALVRLFEAQFSDAWANPDILGAWIGFWTLTRTQAAFAAVNADYNARLRALIGGAVARLPPIRSPLQVESATKILASVMDGLWLETCLRPGPEARAEAVQLCRLALARLTEAASPI